MPIKAGVTEADVKEAIERADHNLKVRSVYFDERPKEAMINRRTAFVRLKALRPLKSQPEPPKVSLVAHLWVHLKTFEALQTIYDVSKSCDDKNFDNWI